MGTLQPIALQPIYPVMIMMEIFLNYAPALRGPPALLMEMSSLISPGNEGVVFEHSVETPHIRAEASQDLK